MEKETLWRTVNRMYETVQAIAVKNPGEALQTKDFGNVLGVAKGLFRDNEAIQRMEIDAGEVPSEELAQKLAILKAALDEWWGKLQEEKLRRPKEEALRGRRR